MSYIPKSFPQHNHIFIIQLCWWEPYLRYHSVSQFRFSTKEITQTWTGQTVSSQIKLSLWFFMMITCRLSYSSVTWLPSPPITFIPVSSHYCQVCSTFGHLMHDWVGWVSGQGEASRNVARGGRFVVEGWQVGVKLCFKITCSTFCEIVCNWWNNCDAKGRIMV